MNSFYVNPAAESVAASVAKAVLILSIILGLILCIAGFASGYGIMSLVAAVYLVLVGVICWAVIRMFVNISHSLYNINEAIRNQAPTSQKSADNSDNTSLSKEGSDVEESVGKFKAGQLVIVKADESQFRINSVSENDGVVSYFSEKFNRSFNEDEIEDFDKYWADKRR